MKTLISILTLVGCSLIIVSCDNTFSPKGPYSDKVVVYSVLSTQTDTQYVRFYTTYNPQGFDPYQITMDKAIRGADVTVSQGLQSSDYRDTTVERENKARYKDNIAAYVAYPFRAEAGKSYNLSIQSPAYGLVTSSLTIPDHGRLQVVNKYVLKGLADERLRILIYIRFGARGYLVRYYLDFDALQGNTWVNHKVELPSEVVTIDDTHRIYSYPELQRRQTTPESLVKENQELVYLSQTAYALRSYEIRDQYQSAGIRINGVWFVLTQVEENLYNYYMVSNAFKDEHSIRTDVPNWTNIKGGNGVFGAFVEDSVYVDLSVN